MELLSNILDFIFPRTSIISETKLPEGNTNDFIPDDEILSLNRITEKDKEDLSFKVDSDYSLSKFAFYHDDEFSKVIHQLKYGGMKKLGIFMGELLGNDLKKYIDDKNLPDFDFIFPVPLFKTKLRERGYNQADLISKGISNILGIEFRNDIVRRVRHTSTQTKLNREERIRNVYDAFIINEKYIKEIEGKKVIIVDDVITTGSTINEVVKVVRDYSKSDVMACTLAMARD